MGFFDAPQRPTRIRMLNVEDLGSNVFVNYRATYANGEEPKNIRRNVKLLNSSFFYARKSLLGSSSSDSNRLRIVRVECIGAVHIGFLKNDTRILFLVTLSDLTMDLIQEQEGSLRCNYLLAQTVTEDGGETEHESVQKNQSYTKVEEADIPIEVLPNLYSLSLSNVSLKYHKTYQNGKEKYSQLVLKCKVNHCLNGRKEGKRCIIFTSYDDKGGVIDIYGEDKQYHFTQAGYEFVHIKFTGFEEIPVRKISVSVKELHRYEN